jgi:hypothetical protein
MEAVKVSVSAEIAAQTMSFPGSEYFAWPLIVMPSLRRVISIKLPPQFSNHFPDIGKMVITKAPCVCKALLNLLFFPRNQWFSIHQLFDFIKQYRYLINAQTAWELAVYHVNNLSWRFFHRFLMSIANLDCFFFCHFLHPFHEKSTLHFCKVLINTMLLRYG